MVQTTSLLYLFSLGGAEISDRIGGGVVTGSHRVMKFVYFISPFFFFFSKNHFWWNRFLVVVDYDVSTALGSRFPLNVVVAQKVVVTGSR